jgi:hypothetical protein
MRRFWLRLKSIWDRLPHRWSKRSGTLPGGARFAIASKAPPFEPSLHPEVAAIFQEARERFESGTSLRSLAPAARQALIVAKVRESRPGQPDGRHVIVIYPDSLR